MAQRPTIATLIASATEIVCALGLRDHLVGISHECDYPPDLAGLPVLSAPKVDPTLGSRAIDRRVRELLRDGLSVYRVRVEELERLKPDLIVTQDHCEVCAVSLRDIEDAVRSVTLTATRVVSLHPTDLDDICQDFRRVAAAAGVADRGHVMVARFRARLDALRRRTRTLGRPRVACLEWLDPLMVAGGWMPELVRIAGGEPVLVRPAAAVRQVTWSDVRTEDPDVVVIVPCGYPVNRTLAEVELVGRALGELRAVEQGACWVVDGNAYFNRPGPRIADSAELLAGLLHSQACGEFRKRYAAAAEGWRPSGH